MTDRKTTASSTVMQPTSTIVTQSGARVTSPRVNLPDPFVAIVQSILPHLGTLLPPDITAEQFRAALYLELTGRPSLFTCTAESLRGAIIKAAMYGFLPGRDCHLLPFKTRGRSEVTYVPNYFGLLLALERSGKVRRAFAHPVHEGDEWGFDLFQDRPVHKPAVTLGRSPGKELFYYGAIMFKDGTCAYEVVSLDDLEKIKNRAPSHEGGPWVTDRVMMCRKSALKRVAKYVRLTEKQQEMLREDEAREQMDIPAERAQQHVVDLFGEGGDPTAPAALALPSRESYAVDATTGELVGAEYQRDLYLEDETVGGETDTSGV